MKIALYIEEGFEQIVLTPETETETLILAKLDDETRSISIMSGSFFECRGGWMRNAAARGGGRQRDGAVLPSRPRLDRPQCGPAGCPL
jgi:hypothetical protein